MKVRSMMNKERIKLGLKKREIMKNIKRMTRSENKGNGTDSDDEAKVRELRDKGKQKKSNLNRERGNKVAWKRKGKRMEGR